MTVRTRASARRLSSAATRSTDRLGWTFESNRSPATRTRSTCSARARSTVATNALNCRSRCAAADSPRSACRAPRCTSAVCRSRSMRGGGLPDDLRHPGRRFRTEATGQPPGPAAAIRPTAPRRSPWVARTDGARPPRDPVHERGAPIAPRPSPRIFGGHCDTSRVTDVGTWAAVSSLSIAALSGDRAFALQGLVPGVGVWSRAIHAPVRPEQGLRERHLGLAAPADSPPRRHPPRRAPTGRYRAQATAATRAREEHGDLRRSDVELRRLRGGVRSFRRRPGVLRAEGVRIGSEALCQLSRIPTSGQGRWLRAASRRRTAGLRAQRRSPLPRVLRGGLHLLRQPGPGAVQAPHGQARLLLGLFPADQAGLTDATPSRR